MIGVDRSFVIVGRSFIVVKGFFLLRGREKNVCRNVIRWEFGFKGVNNFCFCFLNYIVYINFR